MPRLILSRRQSIKLAQLLFFYSPDPVGFAQNTASYSRSQSEYKTRTASFFYEKNIRVE